MKKLGNRGLATAYEKALEKSRSVTDEVFAYAEHGDERLSEILERLGEDHKVVKRYNAANDKAFSLECEAGRRLGPDVSRHAYVTYLRR